MLALVAGSAGGAREYSLSLEDLVTPIFTARSVRAVVMDGAPASLTLTVGELTLHQRTWKSVRLTCSNFRALRGGFDCTEGILDAGVRLPVSFSYAAGALDLRLIPKAGEAWRLRAAPGPRGAVLDVTVENGLLGHVVEWLPEPQLRALPRLSAGTVSGAARYAGGDAAALSAELKLRGVAFSDASGLHAGDKVEASLHVKAEQRAAAWQWSAAVVWHGGEVFWQPLYLRGGGHSLSAQGVLDAAHVGVARASLSLDGVGSVEFDGIWDRRAGVARSLNARSSKLVAATLYERLLKPYLFGTALGNLRAHGTVGFSAQMRDARIEALDLSLERVSFEDLGRRFGVFGATGRIPWQRAGRTRAELAIAGGELLRIPFGKFSAPVVMEGWSLSLDSLKVPLLDGTLTMSDFMASSEPGGWRWRFKGAIAPVSMTQFTHYLRWPTMHGTVSAVIPEVRYARSTLEVDGALIFKVFDGTIAARNVALVEPLGRGPRFRADLDVRGLDLDLLTRAFSFGSITGRVDAAVKELELVNWQPVRFDAWIASSPGEYPRRISQAAVENIAALGGAGASAAIQRTFLRFFDQFSYEKLGLSCRLQSGVCRMGGVETAPQGYVIVKGAGIPSLTVVGYNRAVDWQELVDRLQRVTQDNVRATVR